MAIRIRMMPDGWLVALCAAKSVEQEGDLYLDDGVHYALSQKFWRDYDEVAYVDEDDIRRAQSQEILTAEEQDDDLEDG